MNSKLFTSLLIPSAFIAMQPEDKNFSLTQAFDRIQAHEERVATEYEFDTPSLHPSAIKFHRDLLKEQEDLLQQKEKDLNDLRVQLFNKDQTFDAIIACRDADIKQKNKQLELWYNKACEAEQALDTLKESKDVRLRQLREELGQPFVNGQYVTLQDAILKTQHENNIKNPAAIHITTLESRLNNPAFDETIKLLAKSGNVELIRATIAHVAQASAASYFFLLLEHNQQLKKELADSEARHSSKLKNIKDQALHGKEHLQLTIRGFIGAAILGNIPILGPLTIAAEYNRDCENAAAHLEGIIKQCSNQ